MVLTLLAECVEGVRLKMVSVITSRYTVSACLSSGGRNEPSLFEMVLMVLLGCVEDVSIRSSTFPSLSFPLFSPPLSYSASRQKPLRHHHCLQYILHASGGEARQDKGGEMQLPRVFVKGGISTLN